MKTILMTLIAVSFSASAFAGAVNYICRNQDASVLLTNDALTLISKDGKVLRLQNKSTGLVLGTPSTVHLVDQDDYRRPEYQLKLTKASKQMEVRTVGDSKCNDKYHADAGFITKGNQVTGTLTLEKDQIPVSLTCLETLSWDAGSCYQE